MPVIGGVHGPRGVDEARRAARHLARSDPVLAGVVRAVGPCTLAPRRGRDHFGSLARSIVFQQLSGKAAETIHGRFRALFARPPAPRDVLDLPPDRLRAAGLSTAKVLAVRDLADAALSGRVTLPVPRRLLEEEIVARLTSVRGIGRWTAEMFLIFHLRRPDVLPVGDLGLRKAVARAYGLRRQPEPERLERLAAPWRPYRTYATWYLWRSLDAAGATDLAVPDRVSATVGAARPRGGTARAR